MTSNKDSVRLSQLIEESRRLKLERSFDQAEQYLQQKLAERPNDCDVLSALAVLLLETGHYSKANYVTRKLTSLIAIEASAQDRGDSQESSGRKQADVGVEDDISADLALSRQIANREGFHQRSIVNDGNVGAQVEEREGSRNSDENSIGSQADVSLKPKSHLYEESETTDQVRPKARGTALEQGNLDIDDLMPISRAAALRHEPPPRTLTPPIDQTELDLDELLPIFRPKDEDSNSYRQGVDVNALVEGFPDEDIEEREDEDGSTWSDDLEQEESDVKSENELKVSVEPDEEYAEDAFSESPTPEELQRIPDAKSTQERAKEVALELIHEYDLGAEYEPVLTRIFTEYWWSRCKTSMREQLELAVSAKALDMARQLRELWAEHLEYHENISDYDRYYGYQSLPWRLAVRLVDAYRQYPQFDEIAGFLEYCHGEWDTRHSLQKQFPSYYAMLKNVVDRSESDGVDPSDVVAVFRRVEE